MQFVLYCVDKPQRHALRAKLRVPHLAYIEGRTHAFRFGGPLIDDQGLPGGSLMILELPDRAALDAHMQGDPYFAADLFASVSCWSTRQVMPPLDAGALLAEQQAARQLAASVRPDTSGPEPAPWVGCERIVIQAQR